MPTDPARLRAVALDLDGTLLGSASTIGELTGRALTALDRTGRSIVIATGRSVYGLDSLGDARALVDVGVCSSGSIGFDPAAERILWRRRFAPAAIAKVLAILRREVPDAGIGSFDGVRWTLTSEYHEVRGTWPTGPFAVAAAADLPDAGGSALVVVHARLRSADLAAILQAGGIRPDEATITWAGPAILDLVPPDVDKGYGLRRACDLLGLSTDQVVAFGDGPNDLPMFAVAGLSVAVANAHPTVLEAADLIAPSNEEEGVALTLAELGLVTPSAD